MELVEKKKFAGIALDLKNEIFGVYVAFLPSFNNVYPFCRTQIASLKVDEPFITVLPEYSNFVDVFSLEVTVEFLKHIGINNHTIDLIDSKQPPYRSNYSIEPIELKILKTYMKTNLANSFIKSFKSFTSTLILFH